MSSKKEVYIVGGPNGSGKTTFVKRFLPSYADTRNFVNADDIAVGLSPFDSSSMNIRSGRLMLELIDDYKNKGETFGFETTLAGKRWLLMIKKLKEAGYFTYIFFLDIASEELAVSRVKYRVESGGHDIPEETIRRRYYRSKHNFWYNYKGMADNWYLFNNSGKSPDLVANCLKTELKIINNNYFNQFLISVGSK